MIYKRNYIDRFGVVLAVVFAVFAFYLGYIAFCSEGLLRLMMLACMLLGFVNVCLLYSNAVKCAIIVDETGAHAEGYRIVGFNIKKVHTLSFMWEEIERIQIKKTGVNGDIINIKFTGPSMYRRKTGTGPLNTIRIKGNNNELKDLLIYIEQKHSAKLRASDSSLSSQ